MSRYPKVTEGDILKFREFCLKREAENNRPGGRYSHNVDLYRDIYFYHHVGGNWYLRRDWRIQWNEKYPAYPVDPQSTLKPKKDYVDRRELNDLIARLSRYDSSICWIKYRRDTRTWSLYHFVALPSESGRYDNYESATWRNSIEAYEALNELYEAFAHSCPECGCDWRLTSRYPDDRNVWRCGCCHVTD